MEQPIEHTVQQIQGTITKTIKNRIYDIIAVVIVVAVIALSLGVIERRLVTLGEMVNILIECIPLFFAGMLLNTNFYNKGIFYGKQTEVFVNASRSYSKIVSSLTGEEIRLIPSFCNHYNDEALKHMQEDVLKTEGLTYEQFATAWKEGDTECKPLRAMSVHKLHKLLNKEQVKVVLKAKRIRIKGIQVNVLLGTNSTNDITDVGYNEEQLKRKKTLWSTITYFASTIILSLIAVKNVQDWGWFGIALVIFKVMFIFCRSYMSYFDGYNDVTIHLVNSTNRKNDILKESKAWIKAEHPDIYIGNNIDRNIIE